MKVEFPDWFLGDDKIIQVISIEGTASQISKFMNSVKDLFWMFWCTLSTKGGTKLKRSTSFIFGLATTIPFGIMLLINGIMLRIQVIFGDVSYPFSLSSLNLGFAISFTGVGMIIIGIIIWHFYSIEREKERIWLEYTKEGLKQKWFCYNIYSWRWNRIEYNMEMYPM